MPKSDEEIIEDALDQYEDALEQGNSIEISELLPERPDLLPDLRKQIERLNASQWLDQSTTSFENELLPESPEQGGLPRFLGRYELIELVGVGGFGQVWRAFDPDLRRQVAVKIPRPELVQTPERSRQFFEEARRVARLRHPGIVPVYDVGNDSGIVFLVSDFIEGKNLAELLHEASPPLSQVLKIVRAVADALHHAHENGYVHQDVKPANILLNEFGTPFLTDFGIAATVDKFQQTPSHRGTVNYMSPEQAAGSDIDRRSDVYSLGIVFFEMLNSTSDVSRSIRPDIPKPISSLCLRCLRQNRDDRPSTAGQIVLAIEQIEHAFGRKSHLKMWAILSVCAMLLAAFAAWVWLSFITTQSTNTMPNSPGHRSASAEADPKQTNKQDHRRPYLGTPPDVERHLAFWSSFEPSDLPSEFDSSTGMNFCLIPAGGFEMGDSQSPEETLSEFGMPPAKWKSDYTDEHPRHYVPIRKPFYLGKTEVTVSQFREFVESSNATTQAERLRLGPVGYDTDLRKAKRSTEYSWRFPGFSQEDNHPVVEVSQFDAWGFCVWLSQRDGLRYRLPTESEWEYACRGGKSTQFSFGDNPSEISSAANFADLTWQEIAASEKREASVPNADGFAFTAPVATFRSNPFGLHDMHGNAWEWCANLYRSDYRQPSELVMPPIMTTEIEAVCVRGGGWSTNPTGCRSSYRSRNNPTNQNAVIGFRVLLEPEGVAYETTKQEILASGAYPYWDRAKRQLIPTALPDDVVKADEHFKKKHPELFDKKDKLDEH